VGLSIEEQISELPTLSKADLTSLWQDAFGRAAPPRLRRQVMVPILAYRIQEKAYGGLKPATAKRLSALADALEKDRFAVPANAPRIRSGTRLVREWRGKVHEVLAREDSYEYDGKKFASLSEIARQITGVRWSGPLFFGIKDTQSRTVK
jgi:hypothetical protein